MPLFENSEAKLPFATKALVATSDFVINNWHILIFSVIAFIISIIIYSSTES
jgi:type II secretory pathway component PulF